MRHLPLVVSVSEGATSADGEVRTAVVQFSTSASGGGHLARDVVDGVRSLFPSEGDLSFYLTGALPVLVDQQSAASHTESNVVLITALLILFLLLVGLRALGAPVVVLASAGLALALAEPVIGWSTHIGVEISSLLELLLTALVLGAGTDYGLFLLFRYRENLAAGLEYEEAIVSAMSKVGRSITFSAATVIAALLSLLLASFGLYTRRRSRARDRDRRGARSEPDFLACLPRHLWPGRVLALEAPSRSTTLWLGTRGLSHHSSPGECSFGRRGRARSTGPFPPAIRPVRLR